MVAFARLALSLSLLVAVFAAPPRQIRRPLFRDEFQLEATENVERRADPEGFYVFRDFDDAEPAAGPVPRPPQRLQVRQSPNLPARQTSKREGDNFFRPFKTWQSESYADSHYASDYSAPAAAQYDPPGLVRVRKYSL